MTQTQQPVAEEASELSILIDNGRASFSPRERIAGTVSWNLDHDVTSLELRLFWFTRGKGTQDVSVISQIQIDVRARSGQRPFEFVLPDGPYSFSGRLISLIWGLELVTPKAKQSQRVEFVLAPAGKEIELGEPAETSP
jgi:hypothetical protein